MGFEPMIPFWGIHTFQACLFNHSSISPNYGLGIVGTLPAKIDIKNCLTSPSAAKMKKKM